MSIFKRRSIQMEKSEARSNDFDLLEPTHIVDQKPVMRLSLFPPLTISVLMPIYSLKIKVTGVESIPYTRRAHPYGCALLMSLMLCKLHQDPHPMFWNLPKGDVKNSV
jgi:hypothetical protein